MKIAVDGRPIEDRPLSAAQGTLQLPAGLRGVHAVTVDTAAPVRLLVDRPPAEPGAELYALRSVYRIDRSCTPRSL